MCTCAHRRPWIGQSGWGRLEDLFINSASSRQIRQHLWISFVSRCSPLGTLPVTAMCVFGCSSLATMADELWLARRALVALLDHELRFSYASTPAASVRHANTTRIDGTHNNFAGIHFGRVQALHSVSWSECCSLEFSTSPRHCF